MGVHSCMLLWYLLDLPTVRTSALSSLLSLLGYGAFSISSVVPGISGSSVG